MKHYLLTGGIMNLRSLFIWSAVPILTMFMACEDPTEPSLLQAAGEARVAGKVVKQNGTPIEAANVLLFTPLGTQSDLTSSLGEYSFTVEFDTSTQVSAKILVTKLGFLSDSTSVLVAPGNDVTLAPIVLRADTTVVLPPPGPAGDASSFVLIALNPTEISVQGVGGIETATIVFEARDNQGRPIDSDHAITVNFEILSGPGGGEFITPDSIVTDAAGRALASINSGTVSGPMMIQAQAIVGGADVRSTPVQIAIASGLPDQAHFSVATERLNFWGWDRVNNRMDAVVLVGDKYSNPVKSGTVVSFRSDGGVVAGDNLADITGGSSLTDGAGIAIATIISGNPDPIDPVFGPGYGYLKAQTIGIDPVTSATVVVKDSALFVTTSDISLLSVTPSTIAVPQGGAQTFTITVEDVNGNPIVGGSTISISTTFEVPEGSTIKILIEPISITIPDALFPGAGTTEFTFSIVDATLGGGTTPAQPFPVTVTVTHAGPPPRDPISFSFSGTVGG